MRLPIGIAVCLALAAPVAALSGCNAETNAERAAKARAVERDRARERMARATCASAATNDRLKQVLFDEAIRIRNADPVNLDTLATHSSVRIEQPLTKSRDAALDVTVCTGSLILQIPPGAERAFAGQNSLRTDVEYAAQAAADGSGMVFRIKGAEPIIYKLAAFDLRRQAYRPTSSAAPVAPRETAPAPALPAPVVEPPRQAVAPAAPPPRQPPRTAAAPPPNRGLPSFDCRRARTRSERLVCGDSNLAALDRAMSSQFYSALSNSDPAARAELRRSRDRFLAYRERCPDAGCVAEAYRDRMDEISDIAGR